MEQRLAGGPPREDPTESGPGEAAAGGDVTFDAVELTGDLGLVAAPEGGAGEVAREAAVDRLAGDGDNEARQGQLDRLDLAGARRHRRGAADQRVGEPARDRGVLLRGELGVARGRHQRLGRIEGVEADAPGADLGGEASHLRRLPSPAMGRRETTLQRRGCRSFDAHR
ncbi:MAG: hypothetical protein R3B72_40380 [Polyangiaceae bacterium]